MGHLRKQHAAGKRVERGADRGKAGGKGKGRISPAGGVAELRSQLAALGLHLRPCEGDGNCLFRAVSDQLCGEEDIHGELRALAVAYMLASPAEFTPFLDEEEDGSVGTYAEGMGAEGAWGGNLELVALSGALSSEIFVHARTSYSVRTPSTAPPSLPLHLAYTDGMHWDSVRLQGDESGPARGLVLPTAPGGVASAGAARPPCAPPLSDRLRELRAVAGVRGGGRSPPARPPPEAPPAEGESEGEEEGEETVAAVPSASSAPPRRKLKGGGKGPTRNGPCPCGSLRLYRKCCEGTDRAAGSRGKAVAASKEGARPKEGDALTKAFAAIAI
jgi:hypothetical protein